MTDGANNRARDRFGLVGSVLDRKYRIEAAVAEGGYGVVYAGHHLGLDVRVAVKVLKIPTDLMADEREALVERFVQEARTMARLRHPHIAQVLDTGLIERPDGGTPWIVLEWLTGETLKSALLARRGQGGRAPADCLALLRPVFEAIAYAHEEGVAHRDLKPANIVLVSSRRGPVPKVLDFGIAKVMSADEKPVSGDTSTQGPVAFSPPYGAPEQFSGTRTGPWTDVYALGVILTEVLTDAPPYHAKDQLGLSREVLLGERPTPSARGVHVGPWETLIRRATATHPGDRFESAGAFLAALEATCAEARVGAKPAAPSPPQTATIDEPAPVAPSPQPRPRRFWIASAAGALVAGVVLVGNVIVVSPQRPVSPLPRAPRVGLVDATVVPSPPAPDVEAETSDASALSWDDVLSVADSTPTPTDAPKGHRPPRHEVPSSRPSQIHYTVE